MKKVLSLALVLVLVLGMGTMASAAVGSNEKVYKDGTSAIFGVYVDDDGVSAIPYNSKPYYYAAKDGGGLSTIEAADVNAQDVEKTRTMWFTIDFTDCQVKGKTTDKIATSGLTKSDFSASKITLKTVVKKGSAAIDVIELDTKDDERMVKFKLNDTLKSNNTDGVDYEAQFYLIVDGRHWNNKAVTVSGTLINEDEEIDSDYGDYVYMGDGSIIKATSYIKSIECDLDAGVSVFAKMFKDKKYWAVATTDDDDNDNAVMDKYGFDTVYHLKNVNLAAVADYVLLGDEDSSTYVYAVVNTKNDLYGSGDGLTLKYVGKGDSKLPYADTYYLSTKQIDVEEIDEPIDDEEITSDVPETSEDLGGDDSYPANVNDNPGTGC